MPLLDWFTPDSWSSLNAGDVDYGSSGPILIPGTDLIAGAGKTSIFYVMHTGNLGHESAGNGQIVQSLANNGGGVYGGPVYWNRSAGAGPWMYVWSNGCDFLKAYLFNGATFDTGIVSESTIASPCGESGGVLTLSANGSTGGSGIIWSSMPLADNGDHGVHQGVLRAFNADDLTKELWNSRLNAARDDSGNWAKYSPPTVVNGRVYLASFPADGVSSAPLNVYGLLLTTPDFTISATPASQGVNPGGSTSYTVSTSSISNFSGAVTLSVTGLPSGASASFAANNFATPGNTTLTVNTSSSTPLGTSTLTITGTSGSLTHSVTVSLVVTSTTPTGLTAMVGNSQVSLTWNISAGATSYNLYRSVNGGAYSQLNSSPITTTSYTDTGLTNGTQYCYEATAVNSSGESAKSTSACATPQQPPPPPSMALIQKATFSLQPTSGGTVTLTLPQATGAGHTIIVGLSFWPLDISSVTDGSGDAFTRGLTTSIYHNVNFSATYNNFFYAKSLAGGTTSLTLTFSGGSTYLLVAVAEVSGLDSSAPLDQSSYHDSLTATAAWSSAAVTTTTANEYLFSWAASEASNATCANPASGWVIESQTNPATVCLLDRVVSAAGSYQASVTASTAQNYAMEIVTFKGRSSAPPPSVTSVNSNSGAQGQSLPSVIIAGSSFQSGATCSFGAGITVNSCTFNSGTQLTANITISSTATVGTRNVAVTNPDSQTGILTNGFTVTTAGPPPPPSVSSVNPNSGAQGQNLPSVAITGSNFQSGAACSFGAGITVNSCTFNSATQLTASITISSAAAVGSRNVTVTNPDNQTGTLTNGFSVSAPPAISLIQKATFSREPTSGGTVTLTLPQATAAGHTLIVGMSFWPLDISSVTDGSGDAFTRGLTTSIFHNVSGSATYTNFYYAKSTAGGTTSLTLNFSGGSTYLLLAAAEVAGVDPAAPLDQSGFHESLTATAAWSSAAVTTTAANEYLFSWAASEASNATCANPASGWVIESQTNPATVCLLDRVVSAAGSYQASVTASTAQNYAMEIVTFKGRSSAPPPSVTSVNSNSGAQGQSLPSVIITGSSFQSGATCSFGAGITVNSCTFNSATQLTANITISSTATVGTRNVTVTNPDSQTGTLTNGFTVTTAGPAPPPSVNSVNPSSGVQGQNLPSVAIKIGRASCRERV